MPLQTPPDFWDQNLSPARAAALNQRWQDPATAALLANPWHQVRISTSFTSTQIPANLTAQQAPGFVAANVAALRQSNRILPGLWTVRKIERSLAHQVNKPAGSDGGHTTIRGLKPTSFHVEGQLFIPDHYTAWLAMVPDFKLETNDPSSRVRYFIDHPLTRQSAIYVVTILGMEIVGPEFGGPQTIRMMLQSEGLIKGTSVTPKAPAAPPPLATTDLPTGAQAPGLYSGIIPQPGPAR